MTEDQFNTLFALSTHAADSRGLRGPAWCAFECNFRDGARGLPETRSAIEPEAAHKGYLAGWDAYGRRWGDFAPEVRDATCAAFLDAFQAKATAEGEARRSLKRA